MTGIKIVFTNGQTLQTRTQRIGLAFSKAINNCPVKGGVKGTKMILPDGRVALISASHTWNFQ